MFLGGVRVSRAELIVAVYRSTSRVVVFFQRGMSKSCRVYVDRGGLRRVSSMARLRSIFRHILVMSAFCADNVGEK